MQGRVPTLCDKYIFNFMAKGRLVPSSGSDTCCLGNPLSIVMCPVWLVCPVRASEHEHFMLKSPPPRFIFAMSKKRSNFKKKCPRGVSNCTLEDPEQDRLY